jgi:uncharacterized protein with HEPN domain
VTHGYFDIDLDVVWNTIMNDLPACDELEKAAALQMLDAGPRLDALRGTLHV